ncbi:short-chain collagen C4-like [Mytilus edulis]|uniref:short-chain collagen C4-like n=1 Tax=Mytilus edulis TaxID=6550 RepID=UPI0039F02CAE
MRSFKYFFCFLFSIAEIVAEDKRLLINDPDVMTQIKQMSFELQTLKQKTAQLEQESTQKSSEVSQMKLDLGSAKIKITQLENSNSGFGSVYTRWGRKDCPSNGTELVYTGVTGGGSYDHTGSAVNYVCLPHDPDFIQGDTPGGSATLYGSEYQTNSFGHNLYDNDVPCAVCRAVTKSSVVMIPGKTKCYGDWNREFYGRLAAGADSHSAASEYVCVDHQAQYIEGGAVDNNGKLFYKVGAKCGSLPCPPYYDKAPISCVVCSK